ncbi:MAG: pknA [Blastococcus sp.]|nr:pknA [Blastococcus sp.]
MALSTGSLLAGRYEITAPIAVGGMGEVWKARDQVLDRIVAAKVLKSEFTGDPSFLARFRNEARHTAGLTHPNIASVYDYGETVDDTGTQQLAFLVMEFVEGQPLVSILHDEGALPVDWTLHVISQSADGLSAAHKAGVVHRDIKPGNLMVRPDGVVKLTDFGIAQARDATPLTRTGMVVGTAQYLSPEQAQGLEVNAASDVYSLGVVAFECLTGARPFDGASQVAIALAHINRPPPPLPAHVPPAVRLLVERALAKDPADRFPDGGAFAEAVRRVAAGGTLAPVVGPGTMPTQIVAADALENSRTQVIAVTDATAVAGVRPVGPRTGPAGPMPPLHAAGDDDEWVPEEEPADRRRGGRAAWAWLAAALALLLVLGGGAWWLLGSGDRGRGDAAGTTTSAPVPSATATGLFLDPELFIGEPATAVEATLRTAGLSVTQVPADDDVLEGVTEDLAAGDVAGLDPANVQARRGDTVTLYVAEDAYSPSDDEEEVQEPTPETSEAPAETPTEPTEPTETTAPATTTEAPAPVPPTVVPGQSGESPPTEEKPACEPPAECGGDPPVEPAAAPAGPGEAG